MKTSLTIRNPADNTLLTPATISVQQDNDDTISVIIDSNCHLITLCLPPACALELADALEHQVQKMGGVL